MPHDPTPLVGRRDVMAELASSARSGRGTLLTGPPGSGGTRLLADAHRAARRAGLRVGMVLPRPLGDRPPHDPFLALLDWATAERLRTAHPSSVRTAVLALQLHAVYVDDVRDLNDAASALVVELARSGTAVIANATGLDGIPDALLPLLTEELVRTTELEPLHHDEITELAGHLLGDPVDGELALALMAASQSRPGRLGEVLDDGVGTGSIVHTDGLWRLAAPLPAARSLRSAVLGAFATLPSAQRGWIAAIAQAGELADDVARRIAAPETILATAEGGWTERDVQRGIIRITSGPIATAVLGSIDLRARIAVLRRLIGAAEAVDRPLGDAERVALLRWRIDLGLRPDPHEALALAEQPDTDAEALEPLLRAAVEGGAPADAALADHLRRTRRPAEAQALIREALPAAADDAERVALIRVQSMTTGVVERRSADALAALDAHLATADPHPDLLAVRAAMLLLEARPAESVRVAEQVLSMRDRSGFATAFALLQAALGRRELGQLDHALDAAGRLAAHAAVGQAFPDGGALSQWLPSELTVAVGADPDGTHAAVAAAHAEVPIEQRPHRRPPLAYTLACIRLHAGDPAAGARLLREADAGSGPWREGWRPRILAELVVCLALSGAIDEAAETHDRLLHLACPPIQRCRVELAAAQLAHARGDAATARAVAAEAALRGRRDGLVLDAFDATFAGIRHGDPDAPARLLDLGEHPAGRGRAAQRTYAAALVDGVGEEVDRAAEGLWQVGLRLHAIEAAVAAARLGAREAPTRLVAWTTRTPSLRLPGGADRSMGGLTAREREVALLAAGGASDRAIAAELGITLRTAQTHLGRALAKLGLHRRSGLRGLVGDS